MNREYDVALSFAGEDRSYVSEVAKHLADSGLKIFYDDFEKVNLWGKNLYEHLQDIYQKKARYSVIFASRHYAEKRWPSHELKSMQARSLEENQEYILPARFDSTEIPGLNPLIAYVDLRNLTGYDFSRMILEKVSGKLQESERRIEEASLFTAPPRFRIFADVLDGGAERRSYGYETRPEGIVHDYYWEVWVEIYLRPAERRQATIPAHLITGYLELSGVPGILDQVCLEVDYRTPPIVFEFFHGSKKNHLRHIVVSSPMPVLIAAYFSTPEWDPSRSSEGKARFTLEIAEGDYAPLDIVAPLRYLAYEGSTKWRFEREAAPVSRTKGIR